MEGIVYKLNIIHNVFMGWKQLINKKKLINWITKKYPKYNENQKYDDYILWIWMPFKLNKFFRILLFWKIKILCAKSTNKR